jgi:flagellar basal-body rod modification protein FlgD
MATGAATGAANSANPVVSTTTALPTGSSSSSAAASSSALASQQIAGNFQSFLTLLTTQLQNQNPLDPLDTNQFTQQLVEFAGVQEQLNTNDSLTSLVALQQTAQATQALTFVGKTAIVSGNNAALTNSTATWNLDVPANGNVTVNIANSSGQTVFTQTVPETAGTQGFTWNGIGSDGTQWPDGQYTLIASTTDSTGGQVGVVTQVAGTVSSVNLTQTPPLLTINGQSFTVNQILSISD